MVIRFERRETSVTALHPTENAMSTALYLYMHFDLMSVYRKPVWKRTLARPRGGWEMMLKGS
jgi:hypothetical protein